MKPSQEYTIKILSPEDFDLLPYTVPPDTMGFSDTTKKVAYIKNTGIKDLDMMTINHEFDELMQGTSLHEIDGIRYKSGGGLGKILGPIIGTIVGIVTRNPYVGMAVGAAISGGTQAHSQAVKPEKYGSGFGGIAKSAAIGGIGSYAGTSLINAGRAAAGSASLAGGKAAVGAAAKAGTLKAGSAGTAATFAKGAGAVSSGAKLAAGAKGLAAAAMPTLGTTALNYATAPSAPKNDESVFLDYNAGESGFIPSDATQAFSPQETMSGPLSKSDFDSSMSRLTRNAASQEQNIMNTFRGRTTSGDTAFSRALANTRSSNEEARRKFIADQKTLGSTFV